MFKSHSEIYPIAGFPEEQEVIIYETLFKPKLTHLQMNEFVNINETSNEILDKSTKRWIINRSNVKVKSSIHDIIIKNGEKRRALQEDIKKLENMISDLELKNSLLIFCMDTPCIIYSNNDIGKYKYLSRPLDINCGYDNNITLIPFWIKLECTYPEWSNDVTGINIIKNDINVAGKHFEILIDGLKEALGWDYRDIKNLIRNNNLSIPGLYTYDYVIGSNIKINYSDGIYLPFEKHLKNKYYMLTTDDTNMMINTVEVKLFLVLEISTKNQNMGFD